MYLGALCCIYFFLAHGVFILMYLFLWDVNVMGRHYVFLSLLLFLVSHVLHWLLIYIISLFMIYVFYFMFCEINNLFCFTCIFHTCIYVFVEYYRNIQVDSVMLLFTLATDR